MTSFNPNFQMRGDSLFGQRDRQKRMFSANWPEKHRRYLKKTPNAKMISTSLLLLVLLLALIMIAEAQWGYPYGGYGGYGGYYRRPWWRRRMYGYGYGGYGGYGGWGYGK
ncbi:unnamed protein product [Caenorhabditis auriculariae]|uniref:Uncharacterized protein n=1 Tax=Caenorhabditis auriculariae TaxID=2777116 RepID=A0A8S1GUZ9_9PELO|nr:unnamed protein product [Caenorhabditis auriculariae]